MDKDTQLPAERFNRGDYVAGEDIIILVTGWGYDENHFCGVVVETLPDAQFPKRLGEHSNTWYTRYFKKIEYATKLHQAEQEIEELKRWKMDAIETQLVPIGAYCHEYLEVGLDDNHSLLVIAELERFKQENEKAGGLLREVLIMNEMWGDLPSEFITKVKTFLDGTK